MKKILFFIGLSLSLLACSTQPNIEQDKADIIAVMKAQEEAWSNHDLLGFMDGYWKSDDLKFYGSKGLTSGWDNTLKTYQTGYPTKDHTGTLKFKIIDVSPIENNSYYVMAEYHLTRKTGNANGIFMIIFKKIDGQWKIISDTSC